MYIYKNIIYIQCKVNVYRNVGFFKKTLKKALLTSIQNKEIYTYILL